VIRLRATGPETRIGSLVVNPGGPGGSGVQYALHARSQVSAAVRARFDVVGFDPRGVAGSVPAVHCLSDPQLDRYFATPDTPGNTAQRAVVVSESKLFARGCEKRSGALLPYVGTANAARDMDVLRAALGDAKLTYLGKSYGTYLGTPRNPRWRRTSSRRRGSRSRCGRSWPTACAGPAARSRTGKP